MSLLLLASDPLPAVATYPYYMNRVVAARAVTSHVKAAWAALLPGIRVVGENEAAREGDATWIKLNFAPANQQQTTMGPPGTRLFRRTDVLGVEVRTRGNTGTTEINEIVHAISQSLEGVRLAGTSLWFSDVDPAKVGNDGKWYMMVVEAVFNYFERK